MTLFLPVAPPAAGKSYLAGVLALDNHIQKRAIVSTDHLRETLTGSITDQTANSEVWDIAKRIAYGRLRRGLNVFFDATNLNPDWYSTMLSLAKERDHRVLFILFDTPYDICRARNNARGLDAVPDVAMDRMIAKHRNISADLLRDQGDVIVGSDAKLLRDGIATWIGCQ